ncbi:LysR family transcriptional regulator [Erythrobacteraceae bacterium CFH 75059]|uniref:LysR substrate-binding domain-containing protein n=1 Tax=Qipengyuania thermophila TaxID=2509361 RepID=UPI001021C08A|nr:LysR substrate-binding domain-containing protein [Qipengyuania thermophila]TCD02252.1 LysR family transcriptional regulator [Erythrobacteraceae bacterium CFH 75059]
MAVRRYPPLRALEAFSRTVRTGSVRAAAQQLGLSPSALSRRIAALESFVGRRLFTRVRQSLELTDEGRAFFEAIDPQLEALSRTIEAHSDRASLMRLRLGVLPLFGAQRLFPRLAELRRRHPRLHIDIDTGHHPEARLGDTLDAAIVLTPQPGAHLHAVRLDRNFVHAICDRATAERIGPVPRAEALEGCTFLVHTDLPASFAAWKEALGLGDLSEAVVDHYDSGQLMLEAAAQGLGIAIMHDDHLRRASDPRLASLFTEPVESPYSYWFICLPGALADRPVRLFHDWLVEAQL